MFCVFKFQDGLLKQIFLIRVECKAATDVQHLTSNFFLKILILNTSKDNQIPFLICKLENFCKENEFQTILPTEDHILPLNLKDAFKKLWILWSSHWTPRTFPFDAVLHYHGYSAGNMIKW